MNNPKIESKIEKKIVYKFLSENKFTKLNFTLALPQDVWLFRYHKFETVVRKKIRQPDNTYTINLVSHIHRQLLSSETERRKQYKSHYMCLNKIF